MTKKQIQETRELELKEFNKRYKTAKNEMSKIKSKNLQLKTEINNNKIMLKTYKSAISAFKKIKIELKELHLEMKSISKTMNSETEESIKDQLLQKLQKIQQKFDEKNSQI